MFRLWDLQSEGFFIETVMVFDLVQSLFLERSLDPMQDVINVMLLRPERANVSTFAAIGQPFCVATGKWGHSKSLYLQGLNREERLKLPSFWEINGWKTSVRNWTCGAEFG